MADAMPLEREPIVSLADTRAKHSKTMIVPAGFAAGPYLSPEEA
jgi:hypothetical protein